jgi:hypothetical protein
MTNYRITVRGRLTDRLTGAFGDLRLVPENGVTHLVGDVRDQSELFGLIDRIRDLGIELVRLGPTEDDR